jgi:hypothetical protein
MKLITLLFALFLALVSPAEAKRLAAITITTAVTAQVTAPVQLGRTPLNAVNIQAKLAYGSGGTTIAAWVQTSLDGGASWVDIASFAFTTASLTSILNISALTPITTAYLPTDGTLAAGGKDGVVGTLYRLKYTVTGTYAGNTQLLVDINGAVFTP